MASTSSDELMSKINQILASQEELRKGQDELRNEIDRLRKENKFGNGTYYASLTEIWNKEKVTFKGASKEYKDFRAKDKQVLAIYNEADGTNLKDYKNGVFPSHCMFPGNRKKNENASLAHSAPEDKACIFTWNEAIALFTGKKSESMFESDNLRNVVCGNSDLANNPFKIWNWNYLKLPFDHYKYYDNPNDETAVIITPIWNPELVEGWKPETPYKLMVAATPDAYKWLMGLKPLDKDDPQYQWLGEASEEEYKTGTEFLQLTVKALADLLNESQLIKDIQEKKDEKKKEEKKKEEEKEEKKKEEEKEEKKKEEAKKEEEKMDIQGLKKDEKKKEEEKKEEEKNEEQKKEEKKSEATSNRKFCLKQPVKELLENKYGDNFGKSFIGLYDGESASRRTSRSQKSGSQRTTQSTAIEAAVDAYINKILTLLSTKEKMGRLGTKESPEIYVPRKMPRMPEKPILTIDLGKFFKDKEKMIPDPYWTGMKAGASIARLYQCPLVSACNSLRDELAKMEEEVNDDAPLPDEIKFFPDDDCSGGSSGSSSVCSESERFTGTLGTDTASMLEVGEHRFVSPEKCLDDIASNVVTPEKLN